MRPTKAKQTQTSTPTKAETVGDVSYHHTTCTIYPETTIATYLRPDHEELVTIIFGNEQIHLDFPDLEPLDRLQAAVNEARQRLQARIRANDVDQAAQQASENDQPGMIYHLGTGGQQPSAEAVIPANDDDQKESHVD